MEEREILSTSVSVFDLSKNRDNISERQIEILDKVIDSVEGWSKKEIMDVINILIEEIELNLIFQKKNLTIRLIEK